MQLARYSSQMFAANQIHTLGFDHLLTDSLGVVIATGIEQGGIRTGKLLYSSCFIHAFPLHGFRHTVSELGPGFVAEMRKTLRTRTYAQAKPKALTDEQWWVSLVDTPIVYLHIEP